MEVAKKDMEHMSGHFLFPGKEQNVPMQNLTLGEISDIEERSGSHAGREKKEITEDLVSKYDYKLSTI